MEFEDDDISKPVCCNAEEPLSEPWSCVRNRGEEDALLGCDDVETAMDRVSAVLVGGVAAASWSVDPAVRILCLFVNRIRLVLGGQTGDLESAALGKFS